MSQPIRSVETYNPTPKKYVSLKEVSLRGVFFEEIEKEIFIRKRNSRKKRQTGKVRVLMRGLAEILFLNRKVR